MKNCKRCSGDDLRFVEDYPYEDHWTEEIVPTPTFVCPNCGCLHWWVEDRISYQYIVGSKETNDNVGNWATNHSVSAEKMKLKELENEEVQIN